MNILHTFETYSDTTGGRILKAISEELARRGHSVTVLTYGTKRSAEVVSGVTVHRFPIVGNAVRGVKGESQYIKEYQDYILNDNADVMLNYAAQSWATDLVFPLLAKIKAKKVILPCGYSRLGNTHYDNYFAALPQYLKQYDHIIYLSKNYLDKQFGDRCGANLAGKFSVIPNCADPEEFLEDSAVSFREKFGIKSKYFVVNVTHHYLYKNHKMLWQLVRRLKGQDVTLGLIGKPSIPNWRGCYYFCRSVAPFFPNVKLFTDLPRQDVVSALKEADVMVLTSTYECDPIVMYEAFASKTPFVATPAGSTPEFTDYAHIVPDADEMAARVMLLLENEKSRREISERAFALWQDRYTLSHVVNMYESLYAKLLAS